MQTSFLSDSRFPGGLRRGAEYLAGLRDDGRRVYIDGEQVDDVTRHPAFAEAVRSIAHLYDIAADPANRAAMTFASPATGEPANRIWQLPRSQGDLAARRGAIERWSEASFGLMGRSPDHVAGFFVGWAMAPEVFAGDGQRERADNLLRFYEFLRDNDVYVTYTIIPPQIDRSRPPHRQEPPDLYAGVVRERDDGIVVRGAQMLGSGTAISDYLCFSQITPMRPGDENHALNFAIACNAPGVKILSRRSYAAGATSMFDYPLATRFDETDALVVFEDAFVPWEQVFVYRDIAICRDQWWQTSAHAMGNHQAQIRFATKLRFLMGVARRVAVMNGAAEVPAVQTLLGELAACAEAIAGLVEAQIATATRTANGYVEPGRQALYAAIVLQAEIYPRMLDGVRELCGGGLIQLPSHVADFDNPEIRADIDRYVRSPGHDGEARVKLMKLAWDLVGSEFAGRHDLYEKFYAGPPFVTRARMAQAYDFARAERLVDAALAGYDRGGRRARPEEGT